MIEYLKENLHQMQELDKWLKVRIMLLEASILVYETIKALETKKEEETE